jgi:Protein of unknown function (DUF3102)
MPIIDNGRAAGLGEGAAAQVTTSVVKHDADLVALEAAQLQGGISAGPAAEPLAAIAVAKGGTYAATIKTLGELAAAINTEYEAVCVSARKTLDHAFNAGELLLKAKDLVPRGFWGDWLHEHCDVSERSAQKYMQLARNRAAFDPNAPSTADLTIDEAVKSLAKPKPPTAIEADYYVVPSADYLPSEGQTKTGRLSSLGCFELFGVRADPRYPGFYQIAHVEIFEEHDDGSGGESFSETKGGRPVRADFVKEMLLYFMRRPDSFNQIEWHDHSASHWPFPKLGPRWPEWKTAASSIEEARP